MPGVEQNAADGCVAEGAGEVQGGVGAGGGVAGIPEGWAVDGVVVGVVEQFGMGF